LLYANGPDELKLILVDPKRVELTSYEGAPHLLVPPITKVDDAVNALKWTIREMERRLDVLSRFGAKDIKGFNSRSSEKMPYIVVVIDELADLMMSSGREVESSIVRIAQLARATGIHLVIATQRPSVDVITGIIKANFPGRIAFAVASQTDSRTILDMAGAEKLLGRGDMLFTTAELSKPKRLQGAFVSEKEIERVVDFLKHNGTPDYNYAITERERSATMFDNSSENDDLLDEAIHYMISAGKASTSMLQRRLKIGYSRAARIMDILEEKGIIGPQDGAKPREVLVESWPPENIGETVSTTDRDLEEAGLSESNSEEAEEDIDADVPEEFPEENAQDNDQKD
jgi:S-DNA-T family DNA segregation ATPase FtsK/SpoIIIE